MRKMLEIGSMALVILALGGCASENTRRLAKLASNDAVVVNQQAKSVESSRLTGATQELTVTLGAPEQEPRPEDYANLMQTAQEERGSRNWFLKAVAWTEEKSGAPWYALLEGLLLALAGAAGVRQTLISKALDATVNIAMRAVESVDSKPVKLAVSALAAEAPKVALIIDSKLQEKGWLAASKKSVPPVPPAAPIA